MNPLQVLEDEARRLNALMPVGSYVRFWPGVKEGSGLCGYLKFPWSVFGDHTVVGWIKGHPGCIAATHIEPAGGLRSEVQEGDAE